MQENHHGEYLMIFIHFIFCKLESSTHICTALIVKFSVFGNLFFPASSRRLPYIFFHAFLLLLEEKKKKLLINRKLFALFFVLEKRLSRYNFRRAHSIILVKIFYFYFFVFHSWICLIVILIEIPPCHSFVFFSSFFCLCLSLSLYPISS